MNTPPKTKSCLKPLFFIGFLFLLASANAQMVTGVWHGKINRQNAEVKIVKSGDSIRGTSYYYASFGRYRRYSKGITAASVNANFHTMCNGANLAYTKTAFEAVNGFEGIDKMPTGDDMLLMHKIWKRDPAKVFYLKSKDVIVSTEPMNSWKAFFNQRRRWASKALVYDDVRIIAVLVFVLLLNLLSFVLLLAGFFQPVYFLYLLLFLIGKALIEWPFVSSVARFYGQQKLLRYFFLLQPLHVFYTVFVGIWSQFGGYQWKGRKA